MSKEIINIFHKWLEKARIGKKGYEFICFRNNEWRYCSKDCSCHINSIDIVIWNDEKIRLFYRWNKEKDMDSRKMITFIIKDEKQLLFSDDNADYFAWGISDKINSTDSAMILFECGGVETIIAISKDAEEITVLYHVLNTEPDALTINWNFLMNCVFNGKKMEREVNEDAGANELAVDESNAGWM